MNYQIKPRRQVMAHGVSREITQKIIAFSIKSCRSLFLGPSSLLFSSASSDGIKVANYAWLVFVYLLGQLAEMQGAGAGFSLSFFKNCAAWYSFCTGFLSRHAQKTAGYFASSRICSCGGGRILLQLPPYLILRIANSIKCQFHSRSSLTESILDVTAHS